MSLLSSFSFLLHSVCLIRAFAVRIIIQSRTKSFHRSSTSRIINSIKEQEPTSNEIMPQTTPPTQKQVVQHEKAFNLARRWSVQNENDLLQEDIMEDSMNIGKPQYSHDMCKELASHMVHTKSLPEDCKKYKDVVSDLQRRDSDTTDPTAMLS